VDKSAASSSVNADSVAATNRRLTVDFPVPVAVRSTASPTGSNPTG
jgi:hypothetical protein